MIICSLRVELCRWRRDQGDVYMCIVGGVGYDCCWVLGI